MSSAPLSVRDVVDADYARWLPLWDGYNEFYGRVGATALPIEVTRATWERLIEPCEPVHALVAEDAGAVVGIAHYVFHRSTTSIAHTCYLQDLFTVESARGRGIARALVAAVCDAAKAAGSSRVYWQTHETNATARALYDKIADRSGFIVYRIAL